MPEHESNIHYIKAMCDKHIIKSNLYKKKIRGYRSIKKGSQFLESLLFVSDSGRIQTCNLLSRNQVFDYFVIIFFLVKI